MATVVVGAALLRDGRLLAAQRAGPPPLAGLWELPGGKVEPGESDEAALVRECREELAVSVVLGERVGGDFPIGTSGAVLRVWTAAVDDADTEPRSSEHADLRWLAAEELDTVPWLPADLPLVPLLREVLADPAD